MGNWFEKGTFGKLVFNVMISVIHHDQLHMCYIVLYILGCGEGTVGGHQGSVMLCSNSK